MSAQAGDGQNELFLSPDNVLPPALLMWAGVRSPCSVTGGREGKLVCRCTGGVSSPPGGSSLPASDSFPKGKRSAGGAVLPHAVCLTCTAGETEDLFFSSH